MLAKQVVDRYRPTRSANQGIAWVHYGTPPQPADQSSFPFVEERGKRRLTKGRTVPKVARPSFLCSWHQYSFDFKFVSVEQKIAGICSSLMELKLLIESRDTLSQYECDIILQTVSNIVQNNTPPIRFVPMRLHVYLDHHFIVYCTNNLGKDRLLRDIAMKLEDRGKYFFGDIVQLTEEYLLEFLSAAEIVHLRNTLRMVNNFDINMKVPRWTSPLDRGSSR